MAEKLLTASEIAALRLPGLPTTRAAIGVMAKREKWYFEEKTGLGGTRKLFEIPQRYLQHGEMPLGLAASEIAALQLPGLPATKVGITDRAMREHWAYTEAKGVGGTRRLYEVPAHYLPRGVTATVPSQAPPATVAGTIAGGSRADPALLALAVRAMEEWAQENRMVIDAERKGAIISVLYNYLTKGADQGDIGQLLKIVC